MYIEIILIGIIIFFLLIYTGTISTSKFFGENKGLFSMLQEKDYEFLLRAKYGDRVYDVNQVFRKRVMQGLIAMAITLFIFLSNLKPLYILIIVIKTLIKRAINIIEFVLAPTQIIIKGPKATFGREFKTVR